MRQPYRFPARLEPYRTFVDITPFSSIEAALGPSSALQDEQVAGMDLTRARVRIKAQVALLERMAVNTKPTL